MSAANGLRSVGRRSLGDGSHLVDGDLAAAATVASKTGRPGASFESVAESCRW